MIKFTTIIFDLGGVLLDIDFNRLNKSFADLGVDNFEEMYSKSSADPLFKNLETGKIGEEDFYNAIKKCTKKAITNEEIEIAWNSLLCDYRKASLEEVTRLRSKYFCILLSNTNSIHLRAFRKIFDNSIGTGTLEEYFHKVYYSHEIGVRKPDAECYELVLKQNQLNAFETLLIDDSIQNIEGAGSIGIHATWLEKNMTVEKLGL